MCYYDGQLDGIESFILYFGIPKKKKITVNYEKFEERFLKMCNTYSSSSHFVKYRNCNSPCDWWCLCRYILFNCEPSFI